MYTLKHTTIQPKSASIAKAKSAKHPPEYRHLQVHVKPPSNSSPQLIDRLASEKDILLCLLLCITEGTFSIFQIVQSISGRQSVLCQYL